MNGEKIYYRPPQQSYNRSSNSYPRNNSHSSDWKDKRSDTSAKDAYSKDTYSKDERKFEQKDKAEGDSGITCHYCGVKNHYAKDCMLKKQQNEEREPEGKPTGGKIKNASYYAEKF